MAHYMMRFGYTPEAWQRLIANPEDRRKVASAVIESLGGSLQGFWYTLGDWDAFILFEAPNNIAAAAISTGILSRGSLRSAETIALLSVEETMEMLTMAKDLPYRAPGVTA